eukprot:scaffold302_cov247-Pinguiococcus_pyrenoidosus.AAC.27
MASVFLGDLDDFLAPSEECVNPVFRAPSTDSEGLLNVSAINDAELDSEAVDALKLPSDSVVKFSRGDGANQVAKVQLSDCLACSGCLTSAETVLFQQQTSSTLKALEQAPETPKVVSLSSASRAALANFFGVPPADAGVGLLKVLEELGSFRILDAGLAHSLVLDEALEEFLGRYQEQRQKGERRRKRGRHAVEWRKNAAEAPVTEAGLPLLASECPGWVLYVEKSAPEALPYISRVKSSMRVSGWIAKVSEAFWTAREPPTRTVVAFHFSLNEHTTIYPWKTAREEYSAPFWHPKMGSATRVGRLLEPPQSPFFFGSRVRWSMCDRSKAGLEANATETIHISIQPCADKKLEAARKDSLGKEVDVTLTTTELIDYVLDAFEAKKSSSEQLARLDAGDWFRGCIESALGGVTQEQLSLLATSFRADDTPKENRSRQLVWTGLPVPDSAGSGGYAEFVFRGAARRLFDIELPEDQLPWEQARNSDSHVLVLNADGSVGGVGDTEEEPLLVFARAYGFRNIQGLLGNFRRGHAKHDYVEVMACPSGCSNGGGHPRNVLETAPQNGDEPASTPASVAKLAADVERLQHQREQGKIDTVDVKKRISESGRTTRRDFLYTSYQAVPKLQSMSSSGLKW